MGAKQTKFECSFLPGTPVQSPSSEFISCEEDSLDPRSPAEHRTPIHLQNKRINTNVQLVSVDVPNRCRNNDTALEVLRKRFFKGFTYHLNDPRSPSLNLNRTPLVFEDTLEKSFNLDDTFADLFVEPCLPECVNVVTSSTEVADGNSKQAVDVEMSEEKVVINLEEPEKDPQTPVALQQDFDPRSPSIGVERTPIIFTDEVNETSEDIMLENILATLSLNFNSSGNSDSSILTQKLNADLNNINKVPIVPKPTNKHLERVRAGKKSASKVKHGKPKRRLSSQQIYEDRENHITTPPKLKVAKIDRTDLLKVKRTPLSCMRNGNGPFTRSRSVELSVKSTKKCLALTSFDDSLNLAENHNIATNLRIMQKESQNSLEH